MKNIRSRSDKDHLDLAFKEREYAEKLWEKSLSMFTENPNQDTRSFLLDMMERLNRIANIILHLSYLVKEKDPVDHYKPQGPKRSGNMKDTTNSSINNW